MSVIEHWEARHAVEMATGDAPRRQSKRALSASQLNYAAFLRRKVQSGARLNDTREVYLSAARHSVRTARFNRTGER